ncbi:MAG TPA: lipase maturation factor family protein [Alphaproteobacteria bacterium]|nr:lipase maturation factor family protein [Alphaproteobacteria bacterium]
MQDASETDPAETLTEPALPVLVWDGECGFCGYWVRYWAKLTGDRVTYRPFQEAAPDYPDVPLAEFQRASQYIAPNGFRASAAEASFRVLSHAPGKGFWLQLYRKFPGFAAVSELAYRFIAAHRSAFYRISVLLCGRTLEPPSYTVVAYLFLRLFGLIYLAAFVSFGWQAQGLIGSHGIEPLQAFVSSVASRFGPERFYLLPMVFWLNAGDTAIHAVCWAGAGVSLLLAGGFLPRLSLAVLYVLYLSLLGAGQTFMSYQWDTFLLEGGFLALVMSFRPVLGIWLVRWLLFRFMFMSGSVKLLSGDPAWHNLSALSYHFLTQPLPTPVAWYAADLPQRFLTFATGAMFVVELGLPFLIFLPRRLRFLAAFGFLLLEGLIALTGNYNWFNFQTMLLCLTLFDDAALRSVLSASLVRWLPIPAARPPYRAVSAGFATLAVVIVFCSLVEMAEQYGAEPPAFAQAIDGAITPFRIVNRYGLFAVMTTERNEIVIEGSDDAVTWREYAFRDKPGDLKRRPPWNIPDQPRLDWQMWFAALENPRQLPWFWNFIQRLLENEPTVTALLADNPFPDKPPRYVRAMFYSYTFSSDAEKAQGIWWDRRPLGLYFPTSHLKDR